jgi:hypothetical protein
MIIDACKDSECKNSAPCSAQAFSKTTSPTTPLLRSRLQQMTPRMPCRTSRHTVFFRAHTEPLKRFKVYEHMEDAAVGALIAVALHYLIARPRGPRTLFVHEDRQVNDHNQKQFSKHLFEVKDHMPRTYPTEALIISPPTAT